MTGICFSMNNTDIIVVTSKNTSSYVCLCVSADKVLDSCSFRDEYDDCTFYYTVDNPKDPAVKDLEVQVLEKKGEL